MIKSTTMFYGIIISGLILMGSCGGGSSSGSQGSTREGNSNPGTPAGPALKLIEFVEPSDNSSITYGEDIDVVIRLLGDDIPDSIRFYYDGILVKSVLKEPWTAVLSTTGSRLGKVPVKVVAYKGSGRPQSLARFVNIFSDIVPPVERYSVVKTYPHDKEAYTQGLLLHDGFLFESTGQNGKSSLRKVELETGRIVKRQDLESKYFGEGLALLNDKLYQLTWLTNTGFVYDVNTFTNLGTIHYNTQGWGLTTDGDKLIMSDGTNKIFFLEPEYFTVISTVEVFDNKEAVWQLNELEYIDGELWANIYQTDRLARIDLATGKVLAYIDLSGLLEAGDRHPNIEVLNGIAWEKDSGRLFVTGKNWPKLYEIKIIR